jgi:hypothetical protein
MTGPAGQRGPGGPDAASEPAARVAGAGMMHIEEGSRR